MSDPMAENYIAPDSSSQNLSGDQTEVQNITPVNMDTEDTTVKTVELGDSKMEDPITPAENLQAENIEQDSSGVASDLPKLEAQQTPMHAPEAPATITPPTQLTPNLNSKIAAGDIIPAPTVQSTPAFSTLPTRMYLDQTIVPILMSGLTALAKERPADAIQFLSDFLLKHKEKYAPNTQDAVSVAGTGQ